MIVLNKGKLWCSVLVRSLWPKGCRFNSQIALCCCAL
uniref:Uncharacterized protein n=2 Tax=Anguilla anguilla TaxID=7936 RepID=A0A0E9QMD2_ANGAN